MKLLITTGATAPFDDLIQSCLSHQILSTLQQLNFTNLTIQYGHSQQLFNQLMSNDKNQDILSRYGIKISGFSFSSEINQEIKSSRLVISHAGTGSILDCLSQKVPLITVPNTKLMDNHQQEIAEKFQDLGAILVSSSNEKELSKTIEKAMTYNFHELETPNSNVLSEIIYRQAGLI